MTYRKDSTKVWARAVALLLTLSPMAFLSSVVESKGQGVVSTPLTRLGYGIMEDAAPVAWKGMGGVGIGMSSNKAINLINPAAIAASDSLSFLIDIGASINMGHYKDGEYAKTSFLGGLDYVALQLPLYSDKVALGVGLMPLAHTGYGLTREVGITGEETKSRMQQSFSGEGSIQAAYAGLGVKLWNDLYLGARVQYLFGAVEHTIHTVPNSTILSQNYQYHKLKLSNVAFDFGAQYRIDLGTSNNDNLLLGATYAPKVQLTPTLFFLENRNYGSSDKPQIIEKREQKPTSTPHKVGVGFSWNRPGQLTLAGDFSASLWNSVPNIFVNDGLTLTNSYRAALGAEFQPDRYSRSLGGGFFTA